MAGALRRFLVVSRRRDRRIDTHRRRRGLGLNRRRRAEKNDQNGRRKGREMEESVEHEVFQEYRVDRSPAAVCWRSRRDERPAWSCFMIISEHTLSQLRDARKETSARVRSGGCFYWGLKRERVARTHVFEAARHHRGAKNFGHVATGRIDDDQFPMPRSLTEDKPVARARAERELRFFRGKADIRHAIGAEASGHRKTLSSVRVDTEYQPHRPLANQLRNDMFSHLTRWHFVQRIASCFGRAVETKRGRVKRLPSNLLSIYP
jgi:hypothetical protein